METAALLAPVTALEFLQEMFLLSGDGPLLTVYSLQPRPKSCFSLSVLQHYRIHGIRPRSGAALSSLNLTSGTYSAEENELSFTRQPDTYDLAVFGGKAVRLVRLRVGLKLGNDVYLETLGPLLELHDWALDVRWLSGDQSPQLCVAVAHNGALLLDAMTGNILVQRSCVEGCLLYSAVLVGHQSWGDTVLVGGTVFNQLILWKPSKGDLQTDSSGKAPVERRLLGHTGVIFCISYLQEQGLLSSASDDRSVRLWEVGFLGGAGGTCGHAKPTCLRVLYGHQARVFSVCLFPGNLFSAGEDGACLVWDLAAEGKVVRALKGHRAGGVRALAVSQGAGGEERWVATGGADGGVRLWKVKGTEGKKDRTEESLTGKLVDLRLPSHVVPKVVCRAGRGNEHESWSQSRYLVCNEMGEVYQFSGGKWESILKSTLELQSFCMMETTTVTIEDSTRKVNLCALGNIGGFVRIFSISQPRFEHVLLTGSKKIHSLIWQEAGGDVYLLASVAEGLVFRWRVKVKLDEKSSMVLSVETCRPFLLPPCAKRWLTAAVAILTAVQGALWVCGDRRGSLLLYQDWEKQERALQEGEDKTKDLPLSPLSRLFGVHGKQGVTSVQKYKGLLYSTGRDGCVRVLRLCQTHEQLEEKSSAEKTAGLYLEVLRVQRACRGMEWLEGVLFLELDVLAKEEGEEEEEEEDAGDIFLHHKTKKQCLVEKEEGGSEEEANRTGSTAREVRFVILGFQGVHFVAWDPLRQERLLAVPCGGGHRSWTLWPAREGVWRGHGAVVFIKQGSIMASQPLREAPSSAGEADSAAGWSLKEGVHGRGIGCVCRLGRVGGVSREGRAAAGGTWEVVVTGGEDTSVTVLAVHPGTGAISVLSIITDHISSVRTFAAIADRPETRGRDAPPRTLSALLVSAGGRAQLQCYRLLVSWDRQRQAPSCQVIQVAAHRLDEQWERRRNRHKTVKMDPETRYMCIEVLDEKPDCVLLALACSDGALRLFMVCETSRCIDLLWETLHHRRCVLSVASCSLEDRTGSRYQLLFSAATDGKIAVWDLTEACCSSAEGWSSTAAPPVPSLDIPAHQSGINSLAVWTESPERHQDGCLVTVASGGDDGQLTVTAIRVHYPQGGSRTPESSVPQQAQRRHSDRLSLQVHHQLHIPLAHAAPLTALKLLKPGLLASTSADQRVCLWRVSASTISHRGALCSHVADAAGLAVWEGHTREEREGKRKARFDAEHPTKEGEAEPEVEPWTEGAVTAELGCAGAVKAQGGTGETAAGCMGQTEGGETGWVLVCGQGFQLLQVKTTEG